MKSRRIMWPYILGGIALCIFYFIYFIFSSFGYDTSGNTVVFKYYDNANYKRAFREMPDANPKTFTSFGSPKEYGKDENKVYLKGNTVSGADPRTFEIIDQQNDYSRDATQVFWYCRKISDQPDKFVNFKNGFAKDHQHVFKRGKIIEAADPETFELLDGKGNLARDAKQIFRNGKLLEDAHSPTFKNIAFGYFRDRKNVYHNSNKIIGANPTTITVLSDRYAKDAFFVYYEFRQILEADPISFKVVASAEGDYYAEDKYRKYWYGKEVKEFPERLVASAQ